VISPKASHHTLDPADPFSAVAQSAATGDVRALRTLLAAVTPHLLRVVRRVLGAAHPDVEDIAQDSAFALVGALPDHRGECTVLHFACRIAVLAAMNARRREATLKRQRTRDDAAPIDAYPSASPGPDAELVAQARAAVVRELLDALPLEQAEVLALHCVLGYTVREIADTARIPQETVRSRLRLAKNALRERIEGDPALQKIVGDTIGGDA
jgi:RNA polymerase sigma-70 factor (ECF subfamily)